MASFTLDHIRAAAEAKYASLEIVLDDGNKVELVNALRLPKKKRDELVALQGSFDTDGDEQPDQTAALEDALRLVAKTPKQAEDLIAAIAGDLTVLVEIFSNYSSSTQSGEASASQG